MSAPGVGTDPIEDHVADLAATLRGPSRAKARMVAELRDGLLDAAGGTSPGRGPDPHAARQAVRDFGSVAEIAPSFQRELTIRQARHTARAVLLLVPLLLTGWFLLGVRNGPTGQLLPDAIQVVLAHTGAVAAGAALLAASALAATGALARWWPTPERLPILVAWSGTTAAVALGVSALSLVVSSVLGTHWSLSLVAGAVTVVCHARIAASARACRDCACRTLADP